MKTRAKSEKGSTILAVVVIIMVITLFGIASLKSSSSDLMISRNARCYKQNTYRAEAAVMEAAQVLNNKNDDEKDDMMPDSSSLAWLVDGSDEDSPEFDPESEPWVFEGSDANAMHSPLFTDNESSYAVVFEGAAQGSSLNMNAPTRVFQYGIYGISELCDGRAGVVAGYRRRF